MYHGPAAVATRGGPSMNYATFLDRKTHLADGGGFAPTWMPDCLFPFQRHLTEWAIRRGRAALFADCGLGKSAMELVWAENVVRHTNRPVLLLTPLAVGRQMVSEGDKFGVAAIRSEDGRIPLDARVVVANYERLHHFTPGDFAGVVCDESSILKSYSGKTQKAVTRFLTKLPYRLLATATASPNDYVELGTSSEALGGLSHTEMLRRFFRQLDDKGQKREKRKQEQAEAMIAADPSYYKKLAFRVSQAIGQYRLRPHAVTHFWRWVASWARACRKPSDLGFDDGGFDLPPLTETVHVIESGPPPGHLFPCAAVGLHAEREERKRTLVERVGKVATLVCHDRPAAVWCHTNDEADTLVRTIPGAEQVAGRTPEERKVELFEAFQGGQLRVLVLKPKIGAFGLNWQHCNHVVTFASHSFEQYYQLVRRCWRFGQARPVAVDVVATDGEERVVENLRGKQKKADALFAMLVAEMNRAERAVRSNPHTRRTELPTWL